MELRDRLRTEVMRATWDDLAPHFARGALVVADPALDLLDVGVAIARDDTDAVGGWLASADVRRATDGDAAGWAEQGTTFQVLILQPWVLAQPLPP
ncbi:MAG: DUF2288 domain-containing protein [Myxococcota bacterium]